MLSVTLMIPTQASGQEFGSSSRGGNPIVGVLNIDAQGVMLDPKAAGNLVRIELEKTDVYTVMDRYDINDVIKGKELNVENCYGTQCLAAVGKALNADKMLGGSIERFGEKIIISLKLIDVKRGIIEKTDVTEYLNLAKEIQTMVQISVNNLLDIENDKLLVESLIYYEGIISSPTTRLNLNGPRMGFAYITPSMDGKPGMAERLQDPEQYGGFDSYPVMSQFGYQFETQYLSAGNFQALVEFVFMVSGLEQQMFIPSLTFMNGFRLNKQGWEIAFGPNISISRMAKGYYEFDENNNFVRDADGNRIWHLEKDWADDPNAIKDTSGNSIFPNPYLTKNIDKRGSLAFTSGWVWAIGKTFRSGYLNIPINVYFSPDKKGWFVGVSVGFNLRKGRR